MFMRVGTVARYGACYKNHFIVAVDVRRLKIQRVSGEIRASSRRLLQFQSTLLGSGIVAEETVEGAGEVGEVITFGPQPALAYVL